MIVLLFQELVVSIFHGLSPPAHYVSHLPDPPPPRSPSSLPSTPSIPRPALFLLHASRRDMLDFMGGLCHRGLREGAEKLLTDVKGDILQQLQQHAGYRLVLTGHSLGGGEAGVHGPLVAVSEYKGG